MEPMLGGLTKYSFGFINPTSNRHTANIYSLAFCMSLLGTFFALPLRGPHQHILTIYQRQEANE